MIEIKDIQDDQTYIAIYNAQLHEVKITKTYSEIMSIMAGAENRLLQVTKSNGQSFNVSQENLFNNIRNAYLALVHELSQKTYYSTLNDQIVEINIQTDDFTIDVDELEDLSIQHPLIEQLNNMYRKAQIADTDEYVDIHPTNVFEYQMEAFEKLMYERVTTSSAIRIELRTSTEEQMHQTINTLIDELLLEHSKEVVEDILANRHSDYKINYFIND